LDPAQQQKPILCAPAPWQNCFPAIAFPGLIRLFHFRLIRLFHFRLNLFNTIRANWCGCLKQILVHPWCSKFLNWRIFFNINHSRSDVERQPVMNWTSTTTIAHMRYSTKFPWGKQHSLLSPWVYHESRHVGAVFVILFAVLVLASPLCTHCMIATNVCEMSLIPAIYDLGTSNSLVTVLD